MTLKLHFFLAILLLISCISVLAISKPGHHRYHHANNTSLQRNTSQIKILAGIGEHGDDVRITTVNTFKVYLQRNELAFDLCPNADCIGENHVCYGTELTSLGASYNCEDIPSACGYYVRMSATDFGFMQEGSQSIEKTFGSCFPVVMKYPKTFYYDQTTKFSSCKPHIGDHGAVTLHVKKASTKCPLIVKNARINPLASNNTIAPAYDSNTDSTPENSELLESNAETYPSEVSSNNSIFKSSDGMIGWLIVGILIACFVGIGLIIVTLVCVCFKFFKNYQPRKRPARGPAVQRSLTTYTSSCHTPMSSDEPFIEYDLIIAPVPFIIGTRHGGYLELFNGCDDNWLAVRLLTKVPNTFIIEPQKIMIQPRRKLFVRIRLNHLSSNTPSNKTMENAILIEYFGLGDQIPWVSTGRLWEKPFLCPRDQWKYKVVLVFYDNED